MRSLVLGSAALLGLAARLAAQSGGGHDAHMHHAPTPAASAPALTVTLRADSTLPAGAAEAEARLAKSPRHAEWVNISNGADTTRVWVVYPERRDKAPVVIVVHEIFGLSPWIRAVADQLAAEGFIAVAPDLLTHYDVPGSPTNPNADSARAAIRNVTPADMNRQVEAVARWAMALPAALPKYGIVGFCWGGSASFNHAVLSPTGLGASVVYYGGSPDASQLGTVKVPVLGLYGGNDARVNATIPAADSAMKALGKTFEHHIYEGAGHGFLRQQDGQNGANLAATQRAWPATVAWFRRHLGS
jgi:carboxymethylenebutenolidase